MKTTRATRVVAALVVAAALVPASGARAAQPKGEVGVTVAPAVATPGERVLVTLEGWPETAVSVMVCGNAARRGSQDCDLIGADAVRVHEGGARVDLVVTVPPVGCPCVVRVATPSNDVIRTAALIVEGVPGATDLAPATAGSTDALTLDAVVIEPDASVGEQLVSAFAGPTARTLRLRLTNNSGAPLSGLRLVVTVGRSADGGETVDAPPLPEVPATSTRVVRVPIELAAPAWGDYTVVGSVYGVPAPVRFEAPTTNDAWGWFLAIPIALVILARILRRRERARAGREEQTRPIPAPVMPGILPPVGVPTASFGQRSPEVGTAVGNGWETRPYDPRHADPSVPAGVA